MTALRLDHVDVRPVLVHGIRSNNMEASLLAAYTGGLYHFMRSRHAGARRDAIVTGAC